MSVDRQDQTTDFLRLFSESSQAVYWLIRTAVVQQDAADEIFQETSTALWKKFAEFETGTHFTAWALEVARIEVLRFQQRRQRDQKVFGEAFVDRVLAEASQAVESIDRRREWLAECFSQLTPRDRDLVNRRYEPGMTSKALAENIGRSQSYLSKTLSRIHRLLFECISRHESEGGAR